MLDPEPLPLDKALPLDALDDPLLDEPLPLDEPDDGSLDDSPELAPPAVASGLRASAEASVPLPLIVQSLSRAGQSTSATGNTSQANISARMGSEPPPDPRRSGTEPDMPLRDLRDARRLEERTASCNGAQEWRSRDQPREPHSTQ